MTEITAPRTFDPANALQFDGLTKVYKGVRATPEKRALDAVDLDIPRGSLFALLGPNGAGKSTLINILAGLVTKTAGKAWAWGYDLDTDARAVRSAIGVVPQELNFDPFFTPAQILDIQAGLYGVPTPRRRTMELLDLVGLADKADAYTRQLSGGMRRRLMVAKAMVHNPPILILDEPTAGVDIELRQQLWSNVRALNRAGTTVILTTHYLEEAEELCDRVAIINKGKIVANDFKENLLGRIEGKDIAFRVDRDVAEIPQSLAQYNARAEGRRTIAMTYSPRDISVGALFDLVRGAGFGVEDVTTRNSDLEDVFLQLTRAA
ncbi:MAG: ABC transporter ATP-binding protein [Alphaproteobacteria bacterium]|nr:ABC transporter ATP-binding protein [Alphaproteobacteria bacterium]USO08356.1 MAG: ABC transporter ATP-binding protein [Rhodospirillales bacterium]